MGLTFEFPFILEMDNEAARIFCLGSALKTKLKHIDCRQHWVRTLRDRSLMVPAHVDSADNNSDIMTKILPKDIFIKIRDRLLTKFEFKPK